MSNKKININIEMEVNQDLDLESIEIEQDKVIDGVSVFRIGDDTTVNFLMHTIQKVNINEIYGDSNIPLRILHYPQLPSEPYIIEVDTLEEAHKMMNTIANYDLFLLEHNHRPDFSNVMVLEMYDTEEKDWVDWYDDKTGINDLNEYFEFMKSEGI